MRLRYMRLPNLQPLEDIEIRFGYEPILGCACALHFVVGVNGSGKSRLMRALADIFLSMEQSREIPFPVTLVYDLGPDTGDDYEEVDPTNEAARALALARHTIYLNKTLGEQTVLVDFDYIAPDNPDDPDDMRDWNALADVNWDTATELGYTKRQHYYGNNVPNFCLPQILLAYTSGATAEWEELFAPRRVVSQDSLTVTFNNLSTGEERPFGWDSFKEASLSQQNNLFPSGDLFPSTDLFPSSKDEEREASAESTGIGIFVPPTALKLALCAVTLHQAAEDFAQLTTPDEEQNFRKRIDLATLEGRRMDGLRGILNSIDWLWPVTLSLRIVYRPDTFTRSQIEQLLRLYKVATTVLREPEPSMKRRLFFDLRGMQKEEDDKDITTAQALINAFTPAGGGSTNAYTTFRQLLLLQQQGILEEITIALRKRTVPDLILYDSLSDGERVFLGRMAFFHLLKGTQDALVLLDEPETHFNDFWKREMVDIIDNSLRDDSVEVVMSTHSSIALSDAFDTEIVLLNKDRSDGSVHVEELAIKSFGASPIDIMRDIFHAPESVGQRAAEFLDLLLILAASPNRVQAFWEADGPGVTEETLRVTPAFGELSEVLRTRVPRALRRNEDPTAQIDQLLMRMLRAVRRYTQRVTGRREISMADAVEALYQRLGPGYYQFEFRRRLQALRRDSNAASN